MTLPQQAQLMQSWKRYTVRSGSRRMDPCWHQRAGIRAREAEMSG